ATSARGFRAGARSTRAWATRVAVVEAFSFVVRAGVFSAWTVAVDTVLGSTSNSALVWLASLPRSIVTSSGPGVKLAAGPNGLGDSTARERSRLRNSPVRYCCADATTLQANAA